MKTFKRIASVLLALMMVFGSVSLIANAVETDLGAEPGIYSKVSTKFFREDPETGDWIETDRAAKGEEIRVRVYIDTDYAVGWHKMFWVYPNEFMTFLRELYNDSNGVLTSVTRGRNQIYFESEEGPVYDALFEVEVTQAEMPGGASAEDTPMQLINSGYMTADDFTGLGWIFLQTSGQDYCAQLSDEYYAYEFAFEVNSDATGVGRFYTPEASVMTPEKPKGAYSLTKSYEGEGGMVNAKDRDFRDFYADYHLNQDATLTTTSKVTFNAGTNGKVNGTGVYNIDIGTVIADNAAFVAPSVTANTGFAFVGWTYDGVTYYEDAATAPAGSKTFDDLGDIAVEYEDIVLTAAYEEVAVEETYTVSFKAAAGDEESLSDMTDLAKDYELTQDDLDIAAEDLTVPDGKEFAYWKLVDGTKVEAGYKVTSDITLIPHYNDVAPATFSVKFEQADGSEITTLSDLPEGTLLEDIDLEDAAAELDEVDGKHFTGWNIKGTDTVVEAGYAVTTDLVLVPVYADNFYSITYEDADGEELSTTPDVKHGTEITAEDLEIAAEDLPAAEAGKAFAGWKIKGTDTVVAAGYAVKADLVLVPYYTDIKYTVTFYADEAGTTPFEVQTDAYVYNGSLAYPATTPDAPEGMEFDKWSVAEGTAVTDNISVTPIFNDLTFTVTFEDGKDGEISSTPDIKYGTEITAEDLEIAAEDLPAAEAGKAFAGWKIKGTDTVVAAGYAVKADLVLVPYYTSIKYTVTFYADAEGTTPFEVQTDKYEYENALVYPVGTPAAPEGKYFDGWSVAEGTEVTGNLSVTPIFETLSFTVEFKDADGKVVETLNTIAWGTTIDADEFAAAEAKLNAVEGKTFASWQVDGADVTSVVVKSNVVLTPRYEDNTYTVIFNGADGAELSSMADVAHGYALTADDLDIAAEDVVAPAGQKFANWALADGTDVAAGYVIKAETVLVPEFESIKYTVTFYADEAGTTPFEVQTEAYTYEEALVYPAGEPTAPEGMEFVKWNVAAGTAVTDNISVTPEFAVLTFDVIFNGADGAELSSMADVPYGYELTADDLAVAAEDVVVPAGKTFANWALADGTDVAAGYVIKAETVLVPEFESIKYTVTFYADAAGTTPFEVQTDAYVYNDALAYPTDEPTAPEGMYFDGWSVEAGTAVTDNISVTPIFETLSFTVEFKDVDGAEINTYYSVVWGTEFTAEDLAAEAEELPAVEGKTFASWQVDGADVTSVVVKSNVVLTPRYEDNTYTVIFNDADGEEIYKVEGVVYNNAVSADDVAAAEAKLPSLEGKGLKYTGWDGDTAAAVKADATFTATTAKETYTVKFVTGVDGVTVADLSVEYDEDITAKLETPVAEGLAFKGWVADLATKAPAATKIADLGNEGATVTYYAYWTAAITFVDAENTSTVEFDKDEAILAKAPAEDGKADYAFAGWFTAENGAGEKLTDAAKAEGKATYYAYYVAKTDISYSIEIYEEILGKDGEYEQVVEATEIVENATAGDAVVYTKARTGFKAPVLDPADAIVANGLVVKAYYDRIDDITITVNGESKDYEYGEILDPADPETEDGQEFDKWVDKDGNEVMVPTTVTTDMDNLELIPTYKYVITFIVNDEPVKNDAQAEGATIVAPADPSIKGYTFGGWFTAEDGAGEKLADDAKVTGVATYYAKLDVKKNTVVFKDKDGKVIETVDDVPYGTDLNDILPEAPEVPGQTFAGWVDAETGAPMPETMGDITATYVPSYTSNGTTKYTIETYFMDVDGNYTTKTVATADGTLGTKVTVEDKSDENVGYYLDTEMSVMSVDKLVAGTVLKAYYARESVTVTFVDYDGITVLGEYTGLYGSKVEYPADPERAFHTFAGWSATPVTAPVTDITITATYNRVPVVLVNNKTTVEGKNVVFNRDNADMMYINGFYVNDLKNKDDYDRYLAVEGDGYFKVVPVANGKYGTGTRIELYDNYDGRLLETYFIVIYGDVDGDANVTSNDISIARDEALGKTSWSDPEDIGENGQYDAIRTLAADLTGEGNVRNNDVSAITAQVNTTAEINQATREVIYNS